MPPCVPSARASSRRAGYERGSLRGRLLTLHYMHCSAEFLVQHTSARPAAEAVLDTLRPVQLECVHGRYYAADSRPILRKALETGCFSPEVLLDGACHPVDSFAILDLMERERRADALNEQRRAAETAASPTSPAPDLCWASRAAKELGIPPDEEDVVHALAEAGYTQSDILASSLSGSTLLGPRSGISNAARLHRAVRFGRLPAHRTSDFSESIA